MQCQNCNKNKADRTFLINWMGTQYQAHICNECLEHMWRHAEAVGQKEFFQSVAGWWPGKAAPRQGGHPFPESAEADLKMRCRLTALRTRLAEAAKQENYEEAAQLRDRIAKMEQEAYFHES